MCAGAFVCSFVFLVIYTIATIANGQSRQPPVLSRQSSVVGRLGPPALSTAGVRAALRVFMLIVMKFSNQRILPTFVCAYLLCAGVPLYAFMRVSASVSMFVCLWAL